MSGNEALGAPLDASRDGWIAGTLAFGGSYRFVADDRSLGRLGDSVFVFTAAVLAFGLAGTAIVALSGVEIVTDSAAAWTSVVALAYAVAWLVAYGRD